MELKDVTETRSGATAWLRINRPEKRNAISAAVIEETIAALDRLKADPEVRCVVITGEGDVAFCVGMDFKYLLKKRETGEGPEFFDMIKAIYQFPKIIIAAVNGYCLGGGVNVLCACDLAIASERASFGLPEVAHGGPPGLVVGPVMRTVARKHAFELNLMGKRTWDANKAERRGLVNAVVPHGQLASTAQQWADEIAGFAPQSVEYCKRICQEVPDKAETYIDALLLTRQIATEHKNQTSAFDDGLKAFLGGKRIDFNKGTT
ncbi:MAG: enoyl-CoA hydratase/isomerase family protein [Burkholderiales bacterium]